MTILPIRLPADVEVLIKKGEAVTKGQVLAKTPENQNPPHEISLTNLLHVSSRDAGKYLLKQPGESVQVGDILARKSGFLSHTEIKSQVEGIVDRYDRGEGVLVIKKIIVGDGLIHEITAPIEGTIEDVSSEQISLKTEKDVMAGVKGTGTSVQAEKMTLEEKDGGDGFYTVDIKAIDKIVIIPQVSKDTVMKASGIGVKGIVTKEISEADFSYIHERVEDFPLVQVEESVYDDLCKSKISALFLSGKEKIIIPA
jgi:hypothetical protein